MEYAIVEQAGSDKLLVVACDRLEPLQELLGDLKVLTTFSGEYMLACLNCLSDNLNNAIP
jgi:hypothetical protein